MTDKDPKDMTASELLRKAAIRETDEWGNITPHVKMFSALAGEDAAMTDYVDRGGLLRQLADKIDAELAQARGEALRQGAELWAKANGWPDFREGEDFGAWLNRCAIRIPCFEDGEPLTPGDGFIQKYTGECTCKGFSVAVFSNESCGNAVWHPGELVKRPAHEVLGADLLPIKVGETVYRTDAPITEAVVTGFRGYDDGSIDVVCSENGGKVTAFYSPSLLTHTPPDTQERIDADARKTTYGYWRCDDFSCGECPSEIDGKKPYERYNCPEDCLTSMKLDLLRRQRELDKRKEGE